KVVVLKRNSAYLADMDLDRRWSLTPPAGPVFAGGQIPFRFGNEIRESLRNGGSMPDAPDVGQVQVRVQVVLTSKEMALGELQNYAPGKDVLLELKENAEVGIAINGRLLGTGKLVRVGDQRMGVRVVHWNV